MYTREEGRYFISNRLWDEELDDSYSSDQRNGKPQPPLEKPVPESDLITLPHYSKAILVDKDITSLILNRKSRRLFSDEEIAPEALSYILWATQGIKKIMPNNYATLRTVPSAGARHPFETYLYVRRVTGIAQGIYRYVSSKHSLCLVETGDYSTSLSEACFDQDFVGKSAVTFVWSVIPYRTEWRYNLNSYKPILLDAGHVCQNLYLACEALGLGTCAIGAYSNSKVNSIFQLDGTEEFAIYISPVGRY
jgi:SagB-type dehydrogenase family enzyme